MSQFCIECGVENLDDSKFCKSCGHLLEAYEEVNPNENIGIMNETVVKTSGKAIASLVLSVLSLILPGISTILAIIFGHIARTEIKNSNGKLTGDGLALSGLIIGYLFLVVFTLILVSVAIPKLIGTKYDNDHNISLTTQSNNQEVSKTLFNSETDTARKNEQLCEQNYFGNGVEKNIDNARNLCLKAYSDTNETEIKMNAAEVLGNIYFEEKRFVESSDWYQDAVDLGSDTAKFRLAYSYNELNKHNKAIKYYSEYIKKFHDGDAMGNLGDLYLNIKNYKKAISWYTKAVKQGKTTVYTNLGYANDQMGNIDEANQWYEKSANENKDTTAMYNLGINYENQSDYTNAVYWYKQAASNGLTSANVSLARIYNSGYVNPY